MTTSAKDKEGAAPAAHDVVAGEPLQTPSAAALASDARASGTPSTRERILAAATPIFNQRGYSGTVLRDVAAGAQVDLALISYYFGNKAGLFKEAVTAALDPLAEVKQVVEEDRANAGARIAHSIISMMESDQHRFATTGFFRTLVAGDQSSSPVRDGVVARFVEVLDHVVDDDEFADEYALLAAEVLGLIFARWVVPIEPLASADPSVIESLFAERYQRRLDEIEKVLDADPA